jgi:hypothetical protein
MAKNDPKFVRLAPRLSRGCISDVMASGWSISGLDVKPFPDGTNGRAKAAAKWVRRQLAAGVLEPCSKAEYEDVQEQAALIASVEGQHQEGAFQRQVEKATETIRAKREEAVAGGADGPSGEVETDDDEDEDPDEDGSDEEPEVETKTTKKAAAAKKAAGKKK